MMMPLLGTFLFRERFFDLTVDQVARFESIVLKETFANKEFMRQLEGKLKDVPKYGRESSES
jgi:hypothetical protein